LKTAFEKAYRIYPDSAIIVQAKDLRKKELGL